MTLAALVKDLGVSVDVVVANTSRVMFLGLACAVATACASGPRPMPNGVSPQQRFEQMEDVLLSLKKGQLALQLESTGAHTAKFSGSLQYTGSNQLYLTVDGAFDKDNGIHVELDSRSAGTVNRSLSKASTASNHQDPPAEAIGETFAVSLARFGLMHTVATLINDEPVEHANGGMREAVKILDVTEGGVDTAQGQPCHRIGTGLLVNGSTGGTSSVCISDATSLPLQRVTTVSMGGTDMTVTERYTWTF